MNKREHVDSAQRVTCDAMTLEVIRGGLQATLQEMETLIERTAMSPFIREKKDFHAGIFDGDGKLICSSLFVDSDNLIGTILEVFAKETMQDGDIYWYNDCYASRGVVTHTPDQVFVMPVFDAGKIVAFVEGWAHFSDIGGMRPGSLSADCTEIFQEGTIVPPVRLARAGVINDDLIRLFCRNSRFPEMVRGDLRTLLAAVGLGKRRLEDALSRFGRDKLVDAFNQMISFTTRAVRQRMAEVFRPGTYESIETVDSDGQGNGPFKLRYRLTASDDHFSLDLTATDDQSPGPCNLLLNPGAASLFLGNYILGAGHPYMINHGQMAALDNVQLREGSILQPRFPAPLGFRGSTMMRYIVGSMSLAALATQGETNAAHSSYVLYYLRGTDESGKYFLLSDGLGVGYGARPTADGNDATYFIANENYPCEFIDLVYPVRVKRYAINPDTGGAGRWRGGCGTIRELEVLAPSAMLSTRIDGTSTPPWGVKGGMSGGFGGCWINPGTDQERRVNGVSDGTLVRRGDIIRIATGGGGGWGHPFDREPERVLEDVHDGYVSREAAERDYGVVFDISGKTIDRLATTQRRAERPSIKLFHQRKYMDVLA